MSSEDQSFGDANRQSRSLNQKESFYIRNAALIIVGVAGLGALYYLSRQNYLLFHSIVEIFSIVIAFAIFAVAWNSRRLVDNNYFIFVGIAFLFVAGLDVFHTLAYNGMGVFPSFVGSNLAPLSFGLQRDMCLAFHS